MSLAKNNFLGSSTPNYNKPCHQFPCHTKAAARTAAARLTKERGVFYREIKCYECHTYHAVPPDWRERLERL